MTSSAVVVVNFGASELLEANLTPLGAGDRGFAVVVVDNHSSDAERTRVTDLAGRWGWDLVPQENTGFGAGMNAGVAHALAAGAERLVLLNPDVTAGPDVLAALLTHVASRPNDVVAPRQERADGRPGFARGTLDPRTGATRTREPLDPSLETWLSGACLALSADLWARVGGFAEEYFMYWEDLDLCHRARVAGARLVVREDLVVRHDVGGTQGGGKSTLYHYYNTRNRLLFARRNLPRRAVWRWVAATPRHAWRVLLRDGRRPVLRDPRLPLAVLRGSVAGVRIAVAGR